MSYSLRFTHQVTFTFNGKVFEQRWADHNRKPSQSKLDKIDGKIIKTITIPHY